MKSASNIKDLKGNNTRRVISEIRTVRMSSKSDLAHTLNLSFATVSNICIELSKKGYVTFEEPTQFTGGRRPVIIRFNPAARYIVAFDFGDTSTFDMALLDLDFNVAQHKEISLKGTRVFEETLGEIRKTYESFLKQVKARPNQVVGAGAAIPGVYDGGKNIVLSSSNELFANVQLKEKLESLLEIPVVVEKDANMAALYQSACRKKTTKNLLFLHFSRGVTLGIVIGGTIYQGSTGFAGSIDHLCVPESRQPCECGKRGCLASIASLPNILKLYHGDRVSRTDILNNYDVLLTSLLDGYRRKERKAVELLTSFQQAVGSTVGQLIDIFDPKFVGFGGNLIRLLTPLIQDIRQQARATSSLARFLQTDIEVVDEKFGIIKGCGEVALQNWLSLSGSPF